MTGMQLHEVADNLGRHAERVRYQAMGRRAAEIHGYRYIVTTLKGQPLKIGDFAFAVRDVAAPVEIWDATRFDTKDDANAAAGKMWNLNGWHVVELKPLDQQ
jgi:hypothetical protein